MADGPDGPAEPAGDELTPEPCFLDTVGRGLEFDTPHPRLADYLAQRISRRRNDLLAHIQRIHWHRRHGDARRLFGALADLYIALGSHGLSIRQRMLRLSTPQLSQEHSRFLQQHLNSGLDTATPLPDPTWSRLTLATEGSLDLVMRQTVQTHFSDPLQDARDLMDSGHLDQARQVLEAALLQDPAREALHRELLELYRATRDADRLCAMERRLAAHAHPMAAEWVRVRHMLGAVAVS